MIRPARPPSAGSVARHYDDLDRLYRAIWGENLHHGLWRTGDEEPEEAVRGLTELVAERAEIERGDRVCDVGCGYGGPARHLADRYGARVVGLTLSPAQFRHALTRGGTETPARRGERVRFFLLDWLDCGLPASSFDAVVAIESASHMPDKPAFFRQARRVLRPDGRVVVAAWLASEGCGRWQRRHLLEPICRDGRLPGLGTEAEYRRWARSAGLVLRGFDDLTANVRRTWSVCVRRLVGRLLRDREPWRYLLDPDSTERSFALAVVRIWLAYRTGALRYGLFAARAPRGPARSSRLPADRWRSGPRRRRRR